MSLMKGDRVKVRATGDSHWIDAEVTLASSNGKSIILSFPEAAIRGKNGLFIGSLPLLIDNRTIQGLDGQEYEILVSPLDLNKAHPDTKPS